MHGRMSASHRAWVRTQSAVLKAQSPLNAKTAKQKLSGYGAVEGTCRERSERNSEMSVLAQANEHQPYTYGFTHKAWC